MESWLPRSLKAIDQMVHSAFKIIGFAIWMSSNHILKIVDQPVNIGVLQGQRMRVGRFS